jgi:hypothetical protein
VCTLKHVALFSGINNLVNAEVVTDANSANITHSQEIKNNVYGQQLNTAHCICAGVHNEQATGIDDIEVKIALNFQQIQWRCLKNLPVEISSLSCP